jgi:hypothetical protein
LGNFVSHGNSREEREGNLLGVRQVEKKDKEKELEKKEQEKLTKLESKLKAEI